MPNIDLLNTVTCNGVGGTLRGAGKQSDLEQKIAISGSGTQASLEQIVTLRISGSGTQASLEQIVKTLGSGTQSSLEQTIKDVAVLDKTDTQGWDLTVIVGGYIIPKDQLRGITQIIKSEGDSSIATVELQPPTGIQDLTLYQGQPIIIYVDTPSSQIKLFTGIVDIPEIDIVREFLVLRCTNRRRELINNTLAAITPTIGFYSDKIFSEAKDTAQLLDQRLETIPVALDFDAHNNPAFIPWLPKSTADFTLDDPDIHIKQPSVEITSRGRVINKININLEYRFERNYHMQRSFSWTSPIDDSICLMLTGGYTLTHRSMIDEAVKATGWPIKGPITYDPTPASGWYKCTVGFDTFTIGFTTQSTVDTVSPKTDVNGDPVLDSSGNQIQESTTRITTDLAPIFTVGASWFATTRWSQTISEVYTVTVKAPQSITQYGLIERDENHGIEDSFNSGEWENYTAFNDLGLGNNYFINRNDEIVAFNTAFITVLNRAKTSILGSHRDNRVLISGHYKPGVSTDWPNIELKHTIEVTADKVAAIGKVFKIEHTFNIATTEAKCNIELALSQSIGSATDTALTIPTRPSDSPTIPSGVVRLGNHFGLDPTTEAAKGWTGYIGNAFVNGVRTQYQQGFVVDTPSILDELRNLRTLSKSVSYDVEIPDDALTVTFDGKLKI